MLEEYDFRNDSSMDEYVLGMSLRPQAQIREYQEKALSKMFGSGRARSGIIVLPCGAGKTLVGITAMSTINRSTLIVVSTGVAAAQWREQVKLWTTLPEEYIYLFTTGAKLDFKTKPKVIIATYSMLAFSGTRGTEAQKAIDIITGSEWGLVLLDEVHVAPADHFKKSITLTHSRCKLGLTATLVREDDKVTSLIEMIGPKLYEASWLDLSRQGFIATVRCYEVWCPMDPDFFKVWLKSDHHLQRLLYVTNPNKYQGLEMLVMLHIHRGDKVMIFCEDTIAIRLFSKLLGFPYILGETKGNDRLTLLSNFSNSPHGDALFISKIGDNSIDLPDTNVIIQISSHYASRRQEAQRLGRILRQKSTKSGSSVDAHFYTLVSQDTDEMRYATKRQRFLVDQGYAYKVLKQADILEQLSKLDLFKSAQKPLAFRTQQERLVLLSSVREIFHERKNVDSTAIIANDWNLQRNVRAERPSAYQDSDSDSDAKRPVKKKQRTKM
jgi:DNA excision repair protein ERCC-3